jgi:hypothetical protein
VTDSGQAGAKLGFLDSLGQLFRGRKAAAPAAEAAAPSRFDKFEKDFDTAIARVNQQIEERRRASPATVVAAGPDPTALTAQQRAAERAQRIETAHREMREDIEKKHAQLGTGLSATNLADLATFLRELESSAASGRNAQALIPRVRFEIGEKLRIEAGQLAVARLVSLLQRENLGWPDPTHHSGASSAEEIERSRRRRLGEVREAFLGAGFARSAERMFGIVQGWGGDYPDRGTPLWEECVLEGVAAALRAQLLKEFVEVLLQDQDALLAKVEAAIGKELEAVQTLLKTGVTSVDEASQAVAGPFRVLNDVAPKLAWEQLRSKLPSARGEPN